MATKQPKESSSVQSQPLANVVSQLREELCQLDPRQFEELLARALEFVLQRRVYRAKSGYQAGSDMGTSALESPLIRLEAKRYQKNLDLRELRGEINQAADMLAPPDLWILGTTAEAQRQDVDALTTDCLKHGFGLEVFDLSTSRFAKLPQLLSQAKQVALPFIAETRGEASAQAVGELLDALKLQHGWEAKLDEQLLSVASLFDSVADRVCEELKHRALDADLSKTCFYQKVYDQENFVERHKAFDVLDEWYLGEGGRAPAIVLCGAEGVGKTWLAFRWLIERSESENLLPLVITAPSAAAHTSDRPLRIGISSWLSQVFPEVSVQDWEHRVRNWLRSPRLRRRMLVLVDGLNEEPQVDWIHIFNEAFREDVPLFSEERNLKGQAASPDEGTSYRDTSIPLLITCRTQYWESRFSTQRLVERFTVDRFTLEELAEYLRTFNRKVEEFQEEVRDLMRTPRICGLVIANAERLEASGEISLDRLLYEDWKHRYEQKQGRSIPDDQFSGILAALASKALEGKASNLTHEIREIIGPQDGDKTLVELMTGGILEPAGKGKFRLRSERLSYALGFLLLDDLVESKGPELDAYRERLGQFFDSAPGLDANAAILAAAIFGAIAQESPRQILLALLEAFGSLQNSSKSLRDRVEGYFPAIVDEMQELAEKVCLERRRDDLWKMIERSYIKWSRDKRCSSAIETACIRWASFIKWEKENSFGNLSGTYVENRLETLLGESLATGPAVIADTNLNIVDRGDVFRLQHLATTVVSARGGVICSEFFRTLVLTDYLKGLSYGLDSTFAWIIRFLPPARLAGLVQELNELRASDSVVLQKVVLRLTSLVELGRVVLNLPSGDSARTTGAPTENTSQLLEGLAGPRPLWIRLGWLTDHALNPDFELPVELTERLWRDYQEAEEKELSNMNASREAPLARWCSQQLAESWRESLRNVDCDIDYETGSGASEGDEDYKFHEEQLGRVSSWALHLRHMQLLLESQDLEAVLKVWRQHTQAPKEQRKHRHMYFFEEPAETSLFRTLLLTAEPSRCMELILERPEGEGSASRCLRALPLELPVAEVRRCWSELLRRSHVELMEKLQLLSGDTLEIDGQLEERLISLCRQEEEQAIEVASFAQLSRSEALMSALVREDVGLKLEKVQNRYELRYEIGRNIPLTALGSSESAGFMSQLMEDREDSDYYKLAEIVEEFSKGTEGWCKYDPPGMDQSPRTRWRFSRTALKRLFELSPRLLESLLSRLDESREDSVSPLEHSHELYVAICEVLLQVDRGRGVTLLDRLFCVERATSRMGTRTTKPSSEVFRVMVRCSDLSDVSERLSSGLDTIVDDVDLEKFAQFFEPKKDDWLWDKVESDLKSGRQILMARAFTLSGFAHDVDRAESLLLESVVERSEWLERVRTASLRSAQHSKWSKHWFREFLSRESNEGSWAAFRLFLQCVDQRFFRWRKTVLEENGFEFEDRHPKMAHLRANYGVIEELISERRKKEISETFCRTKKAKEIFPWLGGWTYPASYDRQLISGELQESPDS